MPGKEVKRGWRVRWGLFCRMANWLLCIPQMYNHLQDHPLRSEVCRVRGCQAGWQTGLGEEEEDGVLGCCWWMLWILFPKESKDIRMVQIKRNNMGARLEVFPLEALFMYLQRCEPSLTAVRMSRLANLWPRSRICLIGGECVCLCLRLGDVMNVTCIAAVIKIVTLQPLPHLLLPPLYNFTFSHPRNWPLIYPTGMLLLFQKSYFISLWKHCCPASPSTHTLGHQ